MDRLSDLPSISLQTLERNVKQVLCDLHNNSYQNLEPARLVAVTKTVSAQVISALGTLGIQDIGEIAYRLRCTKLLQIGDGRIFGLHWIGPLQTNKVKDIIEKVGCSIPEQNVSGTGGGAPCGAERACDTRAGAGEHRAGEQKTGLSESEGGRS
jgi:hypothetical protein